MAVFIRFQSFNQRLTAVYNYHPVTTRPPAALARVFSGTFYVDVADAQIVQLEGEIQDSRSLTDYKLTYLVKILRQKALHSNLWLTHSVFTRGLYERSFPFFYNATFTYRNLRTELRILDDPAAQ